MTYIKIDNKSYLDNINLRQILSVSGEVLGTFDWYEDKNGVRTKINIILDENVFELTPEIYPNIIDNICNNAVFDIDNNIIIEKTSEQKFKENKIKKKNELLKKSQNDLDFVFEKEDIKENYKKIFDDIEKAKTIEDLQSIIL